jgi:hypothetical protein
MISLFSSGWDIDLSTGKQSIECLADLSDIDEMVAVGSNYPAAEEFYDRCYHTRQLITQSIFALSFFFLFYLLF